MLFEGQTEDGLACIRNIRERYDGQRRSPFDEAECGHHYARAMVAWAAVLALTGYQFSAVENSMTFAAQKGTFFWSNGYAWGTCLLHPDGGAFRVCLSVLHGQVVLKTFRLRRFGTHTFPRIRTIATDENVKLVIRKA